MATYRIDLVTFILFSKRKYELRLIAREFIEQPMVEYLDFMIIKFSRRIFSPLKEKLVEGVYSPPPPRPPPLPPLLIYIKEKKKVIIKDTEN
jgi:hypothetical protein